MRAAFLAAVTALLPILATRPAHALTVTSASVTRDPAKGDSFTIKGEFPDLAIGDASAVLFSLDRARSDLLPTDLKHGKLTLKFTGVRGAPGLTELALDLKKRRFTAKGAGLLLGGLPDALTVHLGADDDRVCAFVPLERTGSPPKPGAKPKPVHYRMPRKVASLPCLGDGMIGATPPAVVVGTPTPVLFEAPGVAAGTTGLQLFAADATGLPTGPPLCALVDDGGPASGDLTAGDGTFSCTITVADAAVETLSYVVTGTRAGTALRSPRVTLPIVPVPTDADVTTELDAHAAALAIWDEEFEALGDTLNARLATVKRILALPGVTDAGISPDGIDLFYVFASGHHGGLLLSPRFGTVTPLPLARAETAEPSTAALAAEGDVSDAASAPGARAANVATCPTSPARTRIGSLEALILTTSFFGGDDDWPVFAQKLDSCLHVHVTTKQLTLPALLTMTDYATVDISTHGVIDDNGRPVMVTDETATADQLVKDGVYYPYWSTQQLAVIGIPKGVLGGGRFVLAVNAAFLRNIPGSFDHAFVYLSHCHSADNDGEARQLMAKGASTVVGFEHAASYDFARITSYGLAREMAERFATTGDAYARQVKVDPNPVADPFAKGLVLAYPTPVATPKKTTKVFPGAARLHIFGDHDLAYVDGPTLAPPSATIDQGAHADFTAAVDRAEDCALAFDWSTSGNVGALSDGLGHQGASFQSTATKVTYSADANAVGTDTVEVAAHAPTDANGPGPIFGNACSLVDVSGCGDGIVQAGEECDGDADAACPGLCQSDCTCPARTLHVTFVGRGKWTQSINGITFTASETWTNHYDFDLFGGTGFPESPGAGTTVDGTSSIVGMNASMPCSDGLVVNRSHGQASAPTPLFWEVAGQPPLFVFDTFGGYDYRLCDGEYNALVGNFTASPQGYPSYSPAIGFATVPFVSADWFGKPAHVETFSGLGTSEVAVPAPNQSATACWNGTIQFSTDANADPPDLAAVPTPSCF